MTDLSSFVIGLSAWCGLYCADDILETSNLYVAASLPLLFPIFFHGLYSLLCAPYSLFSIVISMVDRKVMILIGCLMFVNSIRRIIGYNNWAIMDALVCFAVENPHDNCEETKDESENGGEDEDKGEDEGHVDNEAKDDTEWHDDTEGNQERQVESKADEVLLTNVVSDYNTVVSEPSNDA